MAALVDTVQQYIRGITRKIGERRRKNTLGELRLSQELIKFIGSDGIDDNPNISLAALLQSHQAQRDQIKPFFSIVQQRLHGASFDVLAFIDAICLNNADLHQSIWRKKWVFWKSDARTLIDEVLTWMRIPLDAIDKAAKKKTAKAREIALKQQAYEIVIASWKREPSNTALNQQLSREIVTFLRDKLGLAAATNTAVSTTMQQAPLLALFIRLHYLTAADQPTFNENMAKLWTHFEQLAQATDNGLATLQPYFAQQIDEAVRSLILTEQAENHAFLLQYLENIIAIKFPPLRLVNGGALEGEVEAAAAADEPMPLQLVVSDALWNKVLTWLNAYPTLAKVCVENRPDVFWQLDATMQAHVFTALLHQTPIIANAVRLFDYLPASLKAILTASLGSVRGINPGEITFAALIDNISTTNPPLLTEQCLAILQQFKATAERLAAQQVLTLVSPSLVAAAFLDANDDDDDADQQHAHTKPFVTYDVNGTEMALATHKVTAANTDVRAVDEASTFAFVRMQFPKTVQPLAAAAGPALANVNVGAAVTIDRNDLLAKLRTWLERSIDVIQDFKTPATQNIFGTAKTEDHNAENAAKVTTFLGKLNSQALISLCQLPPSFKILLDHYFAIKQSLAQANCHLSEQEHFEILEKLDTAFRRTYIESILQGIPTDFDAEEVDDNSLELDAQALQDIEKFIISKQAVLNEYLYQVVMHYAGSQRSFLPRLEEFFNRSQGGGVQHPNTVQVVANETAQHLSVLDSQGNANDHSLVQGVIGATVTLSTDEQEAPDLTVANTTQITIDAQVVTKQNAVVAAPAPSGSPLAASPKIDFPYTTILSALTPGLLALIRQQNKNPQNSAEFHHQYPLCFLGDDNALLTEALKAEATIVNILAVLQTLLAVNVKSTLIPSCFHSILENSFTAINTIYQAYLTKCDNSGEMDYKGLQKTFLQVVAEFEKLTVNLGCQFNNLTSSPSNDFTADKVALKQLFANSLLKMLASGRLLNLDISTYQDSDVFLVLTLLKSKLEQSPALLAEEPNTNTRDIIAVLESLQRDSTLTHLPLSPALARFMSDVKAYAYSDSSTNEATRFLSLTSSLASLRVAQSSPEVSDLAKALQAVNKNYQDYKTPNAGHVIARIKQYAEEKHQGNPPPSGLSLWNFLESTTFPSQKHSRAVAINRRKGWFFEILLQLGLTGRLTLPLLIQAFQHANPDHIKEIFYRERDGSTTISLKSQAAKLFNEFIKFNFGINLLDEGNATLFSDFVSLNNVGEPDMQTPTAKGFHRTLLTCIMREYNSDPQNTTIVKILDREFLSYLLLYDNPADGDRKWEIDDVFTAEEWKSFEGGLFLHLRNKIVANYENENDFSTFCTKFVGLLSEFAKNNQFYLNHVVSQLLYIFKHDNKGDYSQILDSLVEYCFARPVPEGLSVQQQQLFLQTLASVEPLFAYKAIKRAPEVITRLPAHVQTQLLRESIERASEWCLTEQHSLAAPPPVPLQPPGSATGWPEQPLEEDDVLHPAPLDGGRHPRNQKRSSRKLGASTNAYRAALNDGHLDLLRLMEDIQHRPTEAQVQVASQHEQCRQKVLSLIELYLLTQPDKIPQTFFAKLKTTIERSGLSLEVICRVFDQYIEDTQEFAFPARKLFAHWRSPRQRWFGSDFKDNTSEAYQLLKTILVVMQNGNDDQAQTALTALVSAQGGNAMRMETALGNGEEQDLAREAQQATAAYDLNKLKQERTKQVEMERFSQDSVNPVVNRLVQLAEAQIVFDPSGYSLTAIADVNSTQVLQAHLLDHPNVAAKFKQFLQKNNSLMGEIVPGNNQLGEIVPGNNQFSWIKQDLHRNRIWPSSASSRPAEDDVVETLPDNIFVAYEKILKQQPAAEIYPLLLNLWGVALKRIDIRLLSSEQFSNLLTWLNAVVKYVLINSLVNSYAEDTGIDLEKLNKFLSNSFYVIDQRVEQYCDKNCQVEINAQPLAVTYTSFVLNRPQQTLTVHRLEPDSAMNENTCWPCLIVRPADAAQAGAPPPLSVLVGLHPLQTQNSYAPLALVAEPVNPKRAITPRDQVLRQVQRLEQWRSAVWDIRNQNVDNHRADGNVALRLFHPQTFTLDLVPLKDPFKPQKVSYPLTAVHYFNYANLVGDTLRFADNQIVLSQDHLHIANLCLPRCWPALHNADDKPIEQQVRDANLMTDFSLLAALTELAGALSLEHSEFLNLHTVLDGRLQYVHQRYTEYLRINMDLNSAKKMVTLPFYNTSVGIAAKLQISNVKSWLFTVSSSLNANYDRMTINSIKDFRKLAFQLLLKLYAQAESIHSHHELLRGLLGLLEENVVTAQSSKYTSCFQQLARIFSFRKSQRKAGNEEISELHSKAVKIAKLMIACLKDDSTANLRQLTAQLDDIAPRLSQSCPTEYVDTMPVRGALSTVAEIADDAASAGTRARSDFSEGSRRANTGSLAERDAPGSNGNAAADDVGAFDNADWVYNRASARHESRDGFYFFNVDTGQPEPIQMVPTSSGADQGAPQPTRPATANAGTEESRQPEQQLPPFVPADMLHWPAPTAQLVPPAQTQQQLQPAAQHRGEAEQAVPPLATPLPPIAVQPADAADRPLELHAEPPAAAAAGGNTGQAGRQPGGPAAAPPPPPGPPPSLVQLLGAGVRLPAAEQAPAGQAFPPLLPTEVRAGAMLPADVRSGSEADAPPPPPPPSDEVLALARSLQADSRPGSADGLPPPPPPPPTVQDGAGSTTFMAQALQLPLPPPPTSAPPPSPRRAQGRSDVADGIDSADTAGESISDLHTALRERRALKPAAARAQPPKPVLPSGPLTVAEMLLMSPGFAQRNAAVAEAADSNSENSDTDSHDWDLDNDQQADSVSLSPRHG